MNKKITGIIFDFEGTLVDFQWKIEEAVNETLSALADIGLNPDHYGESPDYAVILNITKDLAAGDNAASEYSRAYEIITAIYDRYDADALKRWSLYPDTLETLESMKNSGFKLGLVSNVGKQSLRDATVNLNLIEFLDFTVSRNDVSRIKPDPEGLIKAVEKMGSEPADILFVGDSRNDVEAGRAAGMPVCYLRGGEKWPDNFPRTSADLEITELNQIIPALSLK